MFVAFFSYVTLAPATLQAELNPNSLNIKQGETTELNISLRNNAGFRPTAREVYGQLELPEGFIENSLHTQSRDLTFGLIPSGDASHYSLNILAENDLESGTYYAKFTFWGKNVQTHEMDIEIVVNSD
jgi:uncharacterized membrane protein